MIPDPDDPRFWLFMLLLAAVGFVLAIIAFLLLGD